MREQKDLKRWAVHLEQPSFFVTFYRRKNVHLAYFLHKLNNLPNLSKHFSEEVNQALLYFYRTKVTHGKAY